MRLLINEGDMMVRRWLSERAEELGVEMEFAETATGLRDALSAATPDCVVLDACSSTRERLPLWHELRQDPRTQHIPILLYSSSDRWQTVAELAGASVDGYLRRPFDAASLAQAAERAAGARAEAALH
jgi:CheY-like chemotaxis protein